MVDVFATGIAVSSAGEISTVSFRTELPTSTQVFEFELVGGNPGFHDFTDATRPDLISISGFRQPGTVGTLPQVDTTSGSHIFLRVDGFDGDLQAWVQLAGDPLSIVPNPAGWTDFQNSILSSSEFFTDPRFVDTEISPIFRQPFPQSSMTSCSERPPPKCWMVAKGMTLLKVAAGMTRCWAASATTGSRAAMETTRSTLAEIWDDRLSALTPSQVAWATIRLTSASKALGL